MNEKIELTSLSVEVYHTEVIVPKHTGEDYILVVWDDKEFSFQKRIYYISSTSVCYPKRMAHDSRTDYVGINTFQFHVPHTEGLSEDGFAEDGLSAKGYGNSSIRERNGFMIEPELQFVDIPIWYVEFRDGVQQAAVLTEEFKYVDPAYVEGLTKKIQSSVERQTIEYIRRAILPNLFKDSDIEIIHEFNKSVLSKCVKYFDGKDFFVLHTYTTHCGNDTVILSLPKNKLSVPSSHKGLIIGKGGENIKRLEKKYKIKINLS